eukprot:5907708-Ditylum_brightwellii.AAC.1
MALEIGALNELGCFEFRDEGNYPQGNYQGTTLHMVFDIKQDFCRKACLVAGGHLVELLNNEVYSSTVKGISAKLLHVIAYSNKMDAICRGIGNAFVNTYTTKQ